MDKEITVFKKIFQKKYFVPIILMLFIVDIILTRIINFGFISTYIHMIVAVLVIIITSIFFANFLYHRRQNKKYGPDEVYYAGRCILIFFTFISLFISFFGLLILYGAILSYNEYGVGGIGLSVAFLIFAAVLWIGSITRKIIVTKDYLTITKPFLLPFPDLPHDYDDLKQIKIKLRGVVVKIRGYERFSTVTDYILIFNPKKFVKALQKICPDKIKRQNHE